jgi:hypothetical protein
MYQVHITNHTTRNSAGDLCQSHIDRSKDIARQSNLLELLCSLPNTDIIPPAASLSSNNPYQSILNQGGETLEVGER